MANEFLDQFGMILMEQVRDEVIVLMDKAISGKVTGEPQDYLNKALNSLPQETKEIVRLLVPMVVDITLQSTLALIERDGHLDLMLKTPTGIKSLKEMSSQLSDELYMESRWVKRFSQQRSLEDDAYWH